jgi:hypothetical protein
VKRKIKPLTGIVEVKVKKERKANRVVARRREKKEGRKDDNRVD